MTEQQREKRARKAVETWNKDVPIGTEVFYTSHPYAVRMRAKTLGDAWILSGHTAVVMITGVRGCVALDHLEVITNEGEQR